MFAPVVAQRAHDVAVGDGWGVAGLESGFAQRRAPGAEA